MWKRGELLWHVERLLLLYDPEQRDLCGSGGNNSYGIFNINSSSSTIQNNTIDGGNAVNYSYGIFNTDFSSPTIRNNTIGGGSAGVHSVGISNTNSSLPTIQNNTIGGGIAGSGSFGIYNISSSTIQNNTIDGGSGGSNSYGIYSSSSSPTIQNNIVFTSGSSAGYCLYEFDSSSDPAFLENNDLFDCPTAFYVDEGVTNLTSISAVNALIDMTASGNVSVDPVFADIDGPDDDITTIGDNDWHLTSTSPVEVTQGGLDLTASIPKDKDGIDRTVPVSIGAYEY